MTVQNEIAWCYAELDRLSSVAETQEQLIIDYYGKLEEREAELERSVEVCRARVAKEREMQAFIVDAKNAIDFALEQLGPDHPVSQGIRRLFTAGLHKGSSNESA